MEELSRKLQSYQKLAPKVKTCLHCGKEFLDKSKSHLQRYCTEECCKMARKLRSNEPKENKETPKPRVKKKSNAEKIQEINNKARAMGLSYGKYILLYGDNENETV